jgi:hypothetical protein
LDDLCDPGSFVEYGALALAAQLVTDLPVAAFKL